ncbi:LacI family DNA-binding transcriptional regulator [Amycolatopsis nigrescens]|uniref:LacI family DNA-binding transcriptional regulator n=1 Tax=Amycolatopsis nigrescens TaxID=381445 RepID=UPI000363698C|nr:LacI family DNA-binding transcriptional regulator [Amycolatopsis nigrescens]
MATTMAEVARRAGTSVAVVSYVLNDGPRPVAAETRARVLKAAEDLGYRRNRIAAALRSGSSGLVGVVLPDAVNPYFAALGRELEKALTAVGKLTVVANSAFDPARQSDAVEGFLAAQVDGVIVVSAGGDEDPVARARAADTPAVYLHHRPPGSAAVLVAPDNAAATVMAVEHLRSHGHERIAFLAGPDDHGPVGRRLAGWRAAATGGALLRSEFTRAAAARLTAGLIAENELPRALVVATDEQAIGVLAAACAAGVGVPGELALVGCDGTPDAEFTAPSLTVTAQPLSTMAGHAVRRLLGAPPEEERLVAELVRRRSCGCPQPQLQ